MHILHFDWGDRETSGNRGATSLLAVDSDAELAAAC
jgi:hypothetical protein